MVHMNDAAFINEKTIARHEVLLEYLIQRQMQHTKKKYTQHS
jgi:hypothetical protein